MPDGFKATANKSKSRAIDIITKIRGKSTVTNKEIADLIIELIETLKAK